MACYSHVMKKILITYHSQTGNNQHLAELSFYYAQAVESEVEISLRHVSNVEIDDFLVFDAFIFVGPENFAALSGLMKDLFDRTYLAVHDKTGGKSYAVIIGCDNDGRGALAQLQKILTGYRMSEAIPAVIVRGELSQADENNIKEQAEYLVLALESGII